MVEAGRYYLNNNEPGRGMLYLQTVTREGVTRLRLRTPPWPTTTATWLTTASWPEMP